MAGLYIHYPFCKQACHYCNFHFSTRLEKATHYHELLIRELELRSTFLQGDPVESIYFGGGSPSLLSVQSLASILEAAQKELTIKAGCEVTVELNPDDVSSDYLKSLLDVGVNRVSLGVQSFWSSELQMMHRAHDSGQAREALDACASLFENYSVDLIYGMPGSTMADWSYNLECIRSYDVPHLSAYALTVEPKTVLAHQVAQGSIRLLPEVVVEAQYVELLSQTEALGLENYEFSNFGRSGFHSINNSNYWKRKPYLGIGPGAHSYDGAFRRSWNVSNNKRYAKGVETQNLDFSEEVLSKKDCFNETIMTGLRTQSGVQRQQIFQDFGPTYAAHLEEQAYPHIMDKNLFWDGDVLLVTKSAKFLTDGIAADLFLVNVDSL